MLIEKLGMKDTCNAGIWKVVLLNKWQTATCGSLLLNFEFCEMMKPSPIAGWSVPS